MADFSLSPYSVGSGERETEERLSESYNELETKQQLQKEREKTGGVSENRHTPQIEPYLEFLAEAGRREASK